MVLKGASLEVLKKVKHVMQVGIFVAYHASLEKSFLEDDRACIPEAIMKSPLTVPLPNIPLSTNTSISTVPGFRSPNDDSFNEPSLSPLSELAFSSSNIDWIEDDFLGEGNLSKSEVARKENLLLDDNRSILISLSTRCVWKRRICGSFQVYRIKYYGNFDKPLEQYLRENLFDQVSFYLFDEVTFDSISISLLSTNLILGASKFGACIAVSYNKLQAAY